MKICIKCGAEKPRSEFNKQTRGRDGLFPYCRPCHVAAVAAWRAANKSKRNAADRARNERNRKHVRSYARAWTAANPQKVKEHIFTKNHNRRARKLSAAGRNTAAERRELLASYLGRCAYCTSMATEFDHVTPLSAGGCNHIANLVPSCAPCNQSKFNKSLLAFIARKAA